MINTFLDFEPCLWESIAEVGQEHSVARRLYWWKKREMDLKKKLFIINLKWLAISGLLLMSHTSVKIWMCPSFAAYVLMKVLFTIHIASLRNHRKLRKQVSSKMKKWQGMKLFRQNNSCNIIIMY